MNFVSVVVPTHNRPDAVVETVRHLLNARAATPFEIIVVDDGSTPPLSLSRHDGVSVIRTEGVERSRARNIGALHARGELVIFIDDDITVFPEFVAQHVRGAADFDGVIGVGRISLPEESAQTAFGRFRRTIEEPSQSRARGIVAEANFCTAANMSIRKDAFLRLGGFDPAMSSSEDQDLALRFSEHGGRIVFLPEADVIHRDSVADIFAYGRRHEAGARAMAPFLRRYPDRPENRERLRLAQPLLSSGKRARRILRLLLAHPWPLAAVRRVVNVAERATNDDRVLFPLYQRLLGVHLFRGFRGGLAQVREAPPLPESIPSPTA